MKKQSVKIAMSNIIVSLQQMGITELQIEWKVGKQLAVISAPTNLHNQQAILSQTFIHQIAIDYDQQSKSFLSCPSSLTMLFNLQEGRVKIGGYTLFNLSSMLNEGSAEVQLNKSLGSIGRIKFTLRFQYERPVPKEVQKSSNKLPLNDSCNDEGIAGYIENVLNQWISDQQTRYEKKLAKTDSRLKDLDIKRREIATRHKSCLQSEEQPCKQEIHKLFYRLHKEICKDNEFSRLASEQQKIIAHEKEHLEHFKIQSDKDSIYRIVQLLKSRDQHVENLINQLCERTGCQAELSILCSEYEKVISVRGKRIELLEMRLDSLQNAQQIQGSLQSELEQAKEILVNQNRMLKQKLRFQLDELKCMEANKQELLEKAYERLETVIQDSKKMAEKQTEILDEKQRQVVTLRGLLSAGEEKLSLCMRQNIQLHSSLTSQRDEYKRIQKELRCSQKAVEEMLSRHEALEKKLCVNNQEEVQKMRKTHQDKFQSLLKELQELSADYQQVSHLLTLTNRTLSSLLGIDSDQNYELKLQNLVNSYEQMEESIRTMREKIAQLNDKLERQEGEYGGVRAELEEGKIRMQKIIMVLQHQNDKLIEQIKRKDDSYDDSVLKYEASKKVIFEYKQEILDLVANEKRLQKELEKAVRRQEKVEESSLGRSLRDVREEGRRRFRLVN